MFIPKNYALANEIAQNAKINIANFSMFYKNIEDSRIAIKYGNSIFVNIKSDRLPKYFYKAIHSGELTDLTNSALLSYLTSEFECTKKDILNLKVGNPKLFKVAGKTFVKFDENFVKMLKNKVITTVNANEFNDLDVDGVRLNSKKYLVWY